MTRGEAIKILSPNSESRLVRAVDGFLPTQKVLSALEMAISALNAQQSHAALDRSLWEGCHYCDDQETVMELDWIYGLDHILPDYKFCPMCGRPLTEEAWSELERRINGGTTD